MIEIEKLKQIDIKYFLEQYYGYDIVKHGNTRYRLVEHDSLIIRDNKFFWNSRNVGGDIFNLLKELKGLDFKESTKILKEFLEDYKYKPNKEEVLKKEKNKLENLKVNEYITKLYLCKKRKIGEDIIDAFIRNKYVYVDNNKNICFSIKDLKENIIGYEKVGTGFLKFRQNTTGHNGFNIIKGENPKIVYIFESAIDLISYLEVYGKKIKEDSALFLSLSGVRKDILESYIEGKEKINVCVDNDLAGNNLYELLKKEYEYLEIKRYYPKNKDWNDDLKEIKKGDDKNMGKKAIKVGMVFILANESQTNYIDLEETGQVIDVDGKEYDLYRGKTYEDSRKVDRLIDDLGYKEYSISKHLVEKPRFYSMNKSNELER